MAIEPHIFDTRFTTLFRDTFGMNEKEFEMLLSYFEVKILCRKAYYIAPFIGFVSLAMFSCSREYSVESVPSSHFILFISLPIKTTSADYFARHYNIQENLKYPMQILVCCDSQPANQQNKPKDVILKILHLYYFLLSMKASH